MDDTEKELDKKIAELRAIKEAKRLKQHIEVDRPILKKMVGKCYKFRNSYGSMSEGWWLYTCLTDYLECEDGSDVFLGEQYQVTENGEAEAKTRVEIPYGSDWDMSSSYEEISKEEFEKGKDATLRELNNKTALRERYGK